MASKYLDGTGLAYLWERITSLFSSKIPVIQHDDDDVGTVSEPVSIAPNTFHMWQGYPESLTLSLEAPSTYTHYYEYMFCFVTGNTPTTLNITPPVYWNEEPVIESNMMYEVSIFNNNALIVGFPL